MQDTITLDTDHYTLVQTPRTWDTKNVQPWTPRDNDVLKQVHRLRLTNVPLWGRGWRGGVDVLMMKMTGDQGRDEGQEVCGNSLSFLFSFAVTPKPL